MYKFRYFKKFILPSSLSATAVGVGGKSDVSDGQKVRPGDLSLYGEPKDLSPEEKEQQTKLEKEIGKIREEVWVWYDNVKGYREKVVEVVVTAKDHSAVLVQSLRNDELPIPRSGAIAISGLAGIILGLRGGWFRRIVYASTCAGIMTAICYPRETKELTQDALAVTKKYVLISYNFIYGGKESTENISVRPTEDASQSLNPNSVPDFSTKIESCPEEAPDSLLQLSNLEDSPCTQDIGEEKNTSK